MDQKLKPKHHWKFDSCKWRNFPSEDRGKLRSGPVADRTWTKFECSVQIVSYPYRPNLMLLCASLRSVWKPASPMAHRCSRWLITVAFSLVTAHRCSDWWTPRPPAPPRAPAKVSREFIYLLMCMTQLAFDAFSNYRLDAWCEIIVVLPPRLPRSLLWNTVFGTLANRELSRWCSSRKEKSPGKSGISSGNVRSKRREREGGESCTEETILF